jgi:hypothetical protein
MSRYQRETGPGSDPNRQRGTPESRTSPDKIRTYEELQRQILNALRDQNPHWIQPDGSSPIFEFYQKRLAELLAYLGQRQNRIEAA